LLPMPLLPPQVYRQPVRLYALADGLLRASKAGNSQGEMECPDADHQEAKG